MSDYSSHYSDEGFWQSVKRFAKKCGRPVLMVIFELYFAATSPKTPLWAKALCYGALGYFILPIDAIPDLTPILGFSDDLLAGSTALTSVGRYVTPEVMAQAKRKTDEYLGD